MDIIRKTATQLASDIRTGKIKSEQVVAAYLSRIDECEKTVQAWTYLDAGYALEQARSLDRAYEEGKSLGPLHGIPVGLKDIIDTVDMPTENGTVLHAGRQPPEDATVASLLRSAGAVILGKTVTAELAYYAPGKTRNPHNPEHTPGGSSSGSAAAVADHMVPLAVGTQTNGSVIRPASFCGVVGFKPTYGTISRHNILSQSACLDQVGVFARTVEDVALISEVLMAFDNRDPCMFPKASKPLREFSERPPAVPPRLAFVKSPVWEYAEPDTVRSFRALVQQLGEQIETVDLPSVFDETIDCHKTIMEADIALSYSAEYKRDSLKLSNALCDAIERGQKILATDYNRALKKIPLFNRHLNPIFSDYDAILTPAATGQAPHGLASTGNPIFCTIWTLCGAPSISLPILKGVDGLPLGVQLVGMRENDARLLNTANWLYNRLNG